MGNKGGTKQLPHSCRIDGGRPGRKSKGSWRENFRRAGIIDPSQGMGGNGQGCCLKERKRNIWVRTVLKGPGGESSILACDVIIQNRRNRVNKERKKKETVVGGTPDVTLRGGGGGGHVSEWHNRKKARNTLATRKEHFLKTREKQKK